LRPRLAAATNALNTKIAEFENALASLKLGVKASLALECDELVLEGRDLLFQKWGANWRLVVWTIDDTLEKEDHDLLENMRREVRLQAVERFPDMLDALVRAAEKEIERVTDSASSIDHLIPEIGTKP
jgi:hypothetical protein